MSETRSCVARCQPRQLLSVNTIFLEATGIGRSIYSVIRYSTGQSDMPENVLITDDSDFMRNLLREILEEEHNIVGEAENGVEAVEMYKEHEPDVVMMDIAMPIQDGIEATEEIKGIDQGTKVIMCTSVEQEEMMKEAIKAGADGYITKPFQKPNVLEAIEDAVAA